MTLVLWGNEVALVIFSKDRPLQLYGLLESIQNNVSELSEIVVLYHAQHERYAAGYDVVKRDFARVQFIEQSRTHPRSDFYDKLLRILTSIQLPYCMFAVDDIIVVRPIDLDHCVMALRKSRAYGLYLRLGSDITYCYNENNKRTIPPPRTLVMNDIYLWTIDKGRGDWSWYHTVDMTIYPCDQLRTSLKALQHCGITSPNIFEDRWMCINLPRNACGLCYGSSRIINIPTNMVQTDIRNRCLNTYTPEALLELFQNGYRINVRALYDVPHMTVHVGIDLPLEKRF